MTHSVKIFSVFFVVIALSGVGCTSPTRPVGHRGPSIDYVAEEARIAQMKERYDSVALRCFLSQCVQGSHPFDGADLKKSKIGEEIEWEIQGMLYARLGDWFLHDDQAKDEFTLSWDYAMDNDCTHHFIVIHGRRVSSTEFLLKSVSKSECVILSPF